MKNRKFWPTGYIRETVENMHTQAKSNLAKIITPAKNNNNYCGARRGKHDWWRTKNMPEGWNKNYLIL